MNGQRAHWQFIWFIWRWVASKIGNKKKIQNNQKTFIYNEYSWVGGLRHSVSWIRLRSKWGLSHDIHEKKIWANCKMLCFIWKSNNFLLRQSRASTLHFKFIITINNVPIAISCVHLIVKVFQVDSHSKTIVVQSIQCKSNVRRRWRRRWRQRWIWMQTTKRRSSQWKKSVVVCIASDLVSECISCKYKFYWNNERVKLMSSNISKDHIFSKWYQTHFQWLNGKVFITHTRFSNQFSESKGRES